MAQTLRIKTAGGLTKMSLSPRCRKSDGYQTRREKKKISSAAQRYINSKAQRDQLEFLLAANIHAGDWFLVLTYDDRHLPADWSEANRIMQGFCRRIREARAPEKTVYFYNIERNHAADSPSQHHRWHHHMIIQGDADREMLERLWGKGMVLCKRIVLDPDHTFGSLATYLLKEASEFPGKRGWRSSRGLKKPEVDSMVVPDDYTIEAPDSDGVMVLENPGPQLTVYGRFQTIKWQALDRYENAVIDSVLSKKQRHRAAAQGSDSTLALLVN